MVIKGLASKVYTFFDKKSSGSGVDTEPNYQASFQIFQRQYWGVDLADMQSLSKYNKGIKYLLCAIDLFSKYAWVVPLKDKKGISVVNVFKR